MQDGQKKSRKISLKNYFMKTVDRKIFFKNLSQLTFEPPKLFNPMESTRLEEFRSFFFFRLLVFYISNVTTFVVSEDSDLNSSF